MTTAIGAAGGGLIGTDWIGDHLDDLNYPPLHSEERWPKAVRDDGFSADSA